MIHRPGRHLSNLKEGLFRRADLLKHLPFRNTPSGLDSAFTSAVTRNASITLSSPRRRSSSIFTTPSPTHLSHH